MDSQLVKTARNILAMSCGLIAAMVDEIASAQPTPTPSQTTITASFGNNVPITIPSVGAGTPYPSTVNVNGLSGTILQTVVKLNSFNHSFPNDVDVLLVGPIGQKVLLMSDVGGGNPVSVVYLTLSDGATAFLPQTAALVSGTFKPTDYAIGAADTFPAPAPPAPYGNLLSSFNAQSPNGTWSLYVVDDGSGDLGSFAGGWRLTITTSSGAG